MRGPARRAPDRVVRVARGARPSQDRRRVPRDHASRSCRSSTRTTCAPCPRCRSSSSSLDPAQGKLLDGDTRSIGTRRSTRSRGRTPSCRFRTCYPVTLWPIEVASARLDLGGLPDAGGRTPAATVTVRAAHPGRHAFRRARDRSASLLSERGKPADAPAVRGAVRHTAIACELARSGARAAAGDAHLAGARRRRVRPGRGPAAVFAAVVPRLPADPGVLHFPEKFLFVDVLNLSPLRDLAPRTRGRSLFLSRPGAATRAVDRSPDASGSAARRRSTSSSRSPSRSAWTTRTPSTASFPTSGASARPRSTRWTP